MKKQVSSSPAITDGRLRKIPARGAQKARVLPLAKEAGSSGTPHTTTSGGGTTGDLRNRIVVVQGAIVAATDDARLKLEAHRNCMHRVLNAAISEWHRAEKRQSSRDASKSVFDRGAVTEAVKAVLANERKYWAETKVPELETGIEKLRPKLGRAQAKGDTALAAELEKQMLAMTRGLTRAHCRATIEMPSAIYDAAVYFTQSAYGKYKQEAFRGSRSIPSFREGPPVRWRDGEWKIARVPEKSGSYDLTLPVHTDGRKVEYATFRIVPDGGAMHGWMKRMTDPDELAAGTVKQCDARAVYSETKKQWFVKLTGRFQYERPKPGDHVAAMRRGVNNAFVIVYDDGSVRMIGGGDVLAFKRKIKARMESVRRHMKSIERGTGACGHGKKRRQAPIVKIHDSEERFVDSRCKQWAAGIVKDLKRRGVGKLIVAASNVKEFTDSVDSTFIQALLRNWPFAKSLDKVKSVCELAGVEVVEKEASFNTRRCPQCKHVHQKRQGGRPEAEMDVYEVEDPKTFTCEVCHLKRPADQILAWNFLLDEVGSQEPLKVAEAAKKKFVVAMKKMKTEVHADAEE